MINGPEDIILVVFTGLFAFAFLGVLIEGVFDAFFRAREFFRKRKERREKDKGTRKRRPL